MPLKNRIHLFGVFDLNCAIETYFTNVSLYHFYSNPVVLHTKMKLFQTDAVFSVDTAFVCVCLRSSLSMCVNTLAFQRKINSGVIITIIFVLLLGVICHLSKRHFPFDVVQAYVCHLFWMRTALNVKWNVARVLSALSLLYSHPVWGPISLSHSDSVYSAQNS